MFIISIVQFYYRLESSSNMFFQFKHPFSMIISGPSGCGKTTFLEKVIENISTLISEKVTKIIWCFAEQNAIPQIENKIVTYHKGIPEHVENIKNESILIILDDMMQDVYNAKISELFTRGSHHRNTSVILVTQNIFHKGSHSRDISLNAKYLVVFKNPRDQLQFQFLSRQIFPDNSKEVLRIYKEVTNTPHNYLLIDLTQDIHELLRIRSNIFQKDHCEIYCNLNENEIEVTSIEKEQAYVICS